CRVDTMCLRLRLAGQEPLEQVGAAVREALAAQDVPFTEAARSLFASGRHHTVLDLPVLMIEDEPLPRLSLESCRTTFFRPDNPTTMTQLELRVCRAEGGGLQVVCTVWTDRFTADFAAEVADRFIGVLRRGPAALRRPERP
ncbi:hypothetical protein G3I76_54115, partial [Streptomyces sp. SID11233]|nr:hypothetical protein [Streptomyces sp. SID11233]